MRIGYLMNSYPMTSTTFIRVEIEAVEALRVEVKRYAIRRWDVPLVDPLDRAESEKTTYLLSGNALRLLGAFCLELITNLPGVLRAVGPWWSLLRSGERSVIKHVAYFCEGVMLRRRARRDGVRHLHVHFSTNSAAVAMLARLLGGPSYSFTAHGPDEFLGAGNAGLGLKMKHASFVVAISSFCKVQLASLGGMEYWDKIHVVRCGLNLAQFDADAPIAEADQTLVCVGRLCVQKAQLLLPSVAAALRTEYPALKIVLIGDGPIRAQLEDAIRRLGVESMFDLRGWQTSVDVRCALLGARAFLLPSFAEGLPVVLMEALALRRPVITTYIAGIPELVDAGCGWIVPAGSVPDLAAAVRSALSMPVAELARLGSTGRARIEALHDAGKSAAALVEKFAAAGGR